MVYGLKGVKPAIDEVPNPTIRHKHSIHVHVYVTVHTKRWHKSAKLIMRYRLRRQLRQTLDYRERIAV